MKIRVTLNVPPQDAFTLGAAIGLGQNANRAQVVAFVGAALSSTFQMLRLGMFAPPLELKELLSAASRNAQAEAAIHNVPLPTMKAGSQRAPDAPPAEDAFGVEVEVEEESPTPAPEVVAPRPRRKRKPEAV